MNRHEIRKLRLDELINEAGSAAELSRRTGVNSAYISQIVTGTKLPSGKVRHLGDTAAAALERGMEKAPGWMDSEPLEVNEIRPTWGSDTSTKPASAGPAGANESLAPILVWETEGDLPEGVYVFVPTLRLELAAGNGKTVVSEDRGHPKAFLWEWIRDKGLNAKYLVSMKVAGDSMSPWVNDGDSVLIDRSNTEIRDGKPYAIRYGDELRIKHVHRRFDGGLILRSINPEYCDEIIAPAELEHVEILGRVVWRAG